MENETKSEHSSSPEKDIARESGAEHPRPVRSSRRTMLLAMVIAASTIGALAFITGLVDGPWNTAMPVHTAVPVADGGSTNVTGEKDAGATVKPVPALDGMFETIKRGIEDLSNRITEWFDATKADHLAMNRALSELAGSVSAINESLAELRKGNEELKQRVTEAQSRLEGIARDVRGFKTAAQRNVEAQAKRAASTPPFHVDAIDLWDDAIYVAVSQDGRAAFLREGEQQAGWQVVHIDRSKDLVAFHGPEGQDYSASVGR